MLFSLHFSSVYPPQLLRRDAAQQQSLGLLQGHPWPRREANGVKSHGSKSTKRTKRVWIAHVWPRIDHGMPGMPWRVLYKWDLF